MCAHPIICRAAHMPTQSFCASFWDYNIRELALYDLPAMVDHIRQESKCGLTLDINLSLM